MGGGGGGALQQDGRHAGAQEAGHPVEHCITGGGGGIDAAQQVGVHAGAQEEAHVPGQEGAAAGSWMEIGGMWTIRIGGGC